jgi:prepilin-type N-terminal cleavage/methylation domain-containing protein
MPRLSRPALRRGLTLIELVVVMAIIAILAVMVIPRLDFLRTQAEHSSSAGTQADLGAMIQTFKASSNKYPSFDSLISSSGSLYSKLQTQTALAAFDATTIPGASTGERWYGSLADGGFKSAFTHNDAATDASNSAVNAVDIVNQAADGSLVLATIKTTGGPSGATAIRQAIYPGGATFVAATDPDGIPGNGDETAATTVQTAAGTIPTTSKLVVFGVGPKSNLISNVVATAPSSAMGSDESTTTYCRYFVIFEIFSNGDPAKFKMVTDHRLRQISARVDLYKRGSQIQ